MRLHIDGLNLVDKDGKVVKLPGVSTFAMFKRYLQPNGWNALCLPILQEIRRVAKEGGYEGPIILRVFRYAAAPNAFAIDPWSYGFDQVTEFTQLCAAEGFYVDWTAGDAQVCFIERDGPHGRNQHNNEFVRALIPCENAFFNTRNEPFKNGSIEGEVPPNWGGLLRHSGYYSTGKPEEWDLSQDLDIRDFHQPRVESAPFPRWAYDMFASSVTIASFNPPKPHFHDEPMGADEMEQPTKRCNVPEFFGIVGLVISMCSAVYFHSTAGIACDGMGPDFSTVFPITRRCMVHFFAGVVGGIKATL